jgi:hypothetical protein
MTGTVARSDPQMSVITQSNHPARLLTMFGGALAFAAIVASALYAAIWMVQDMRAPETVTRTIGSGDITASGGVQVVLPLESADEFEQLAGFAPFVPERVPANTIGDPKYAVTPPEAEGHRVGRVAFSFIREKRDRVQPLQGEHRRVLIDGGTDIRNCRLRIP